MRMNVAAVLEELKARPNWVVWRLVEREGRPTKVPVDPKTGGPGKPNDPTTWGSFDQAVKAWQRNGAAGVGYVFSADDPFAGIDLDHALMDGHPSLCAQVILEQLASYSEISPSGAGAHIILKGTLPLGRNRRTFPCGLGIEAYDRVRFFTITGHHLAGTPTEIHNRQAALEALHHQIFDKKDKPRSEGPRPGPSPTLDLDDQELIERAHQAANGEKFGKLWQGDWQGAGYPSQSEADLALCELLAFWTGGDFVRIENLFSQSGLGKRDKWKNRPDYREKTIREAMGRVTEYYSPGSKGCPKPEDGQKRNGSQAKAPP